MELFKKAKRYAVDVAATTALATPVLAGLETMVAGMSTEVSLKARVLGVGLSVAGVSSIFTYGREYFRRMLGKDMNGNNLPAFTYDARYAAFFAAALSPFFYGVAGSRDIVEIGVATALNTGIAYVAGGPYGYMLDAAHELTGIQQPQRLPAFLRDSGDRFKRGVAAGSLLFSAGLTALIYAMNR